MDRFEILSLVNGFMAYDHDCDEYLYDERKNNCFDSREEAQALIDDALNHGGN